MSDIKELELSALKANDIQKWAEVKNMNGDVMPADADTLEMLFHLTRMRNINVPVAVRLSSRDILRSHGHEAGNEPVTIKEWLMAHEVRNRVNVSIPNLLTEADEVILLFPSDLVRDRVYMKAATELVAIIDKKKSSPNLRDIWTTDGKHIKFIVSNDAYLPRDTTIVYRVINDAV